MSWANTVFKFLGLLRYTSLAPNLTDGDTSESRCDQNGRLLVNTESPTTLWADSGAPKAQSIVNSGAGRVYQVFGRNAGGSTVYLFLFDANEKPSDGSTAQLFAPVRLEAGLAFSLSLDRARSLTTGLCWAASSTDTELTFDTDGALQVCAEYE